MQRLGRVCKTLKSTRISLPKHLEQNVSAIREVPRHLGERQRWPIHLSVRLEEVIPQLCRLERAEEIAANLLFRYLRTTDHNVRQWQRLQEGDSRRGERELM